MFLCVLLYLYREGKNTLKINKKISRDENTCIFTNVFLYLGNIVKP